MTTDHYEANDREHDETQEMLTVPDNYIIRTDNDDADTVASDPHLFWSNVNGWADLASATVFTKAEAQMFDLPMPPGAADAPVEWVAAPAESAGSMSMSDYIKSECYRRYSAHPGGQSAVFDFIRENYPLIPWAWCKPCESDSPMLGDECLVCGTSRAWLPTPEQVIRDYAEWVRKGGCVGYDGHVESATTSLGSLTLTYADGTMLRLNMTAEYVGNRDHADDMYDDFDMGVNNE